VSRVVIRECSDRFEAEMVRGLLETSGIAAMIEPDDVGAQRPSVGFASGIRVWIDEADAGAAHEALAAEAGERVVLRTLNSRHEADWVCELLRAGGIEATVVSDDCRAIDPALTFANGAHVLVGRADLERAEEILAAPVPDAGMEGGEKEEP